MNKVFRNVGEVQVMPVLTYNLLLFFLFPFPLLSLLLLLPFVNKSSKKTHVVDILEVLREHESNA